MHLDIRKQGCSKKQILILEQPNYREPKKGLGVILRALLFETSSSFFAFLPKSLKSHISLGGNIADLKPFPTGFVMEKIRDKLRRNKQTSSPNQQTSIHQSYQSWMSSKPVKVGNVKLQLINLLLRTLNLERKYHWQANTLPQQHVSVTEQRKFQWKYSLTRNWTLSSSWEQWLVSKCLKRNWTLQTFWAW